MNISFESSVQENNMHVGVLGSSLCRQTRTIDLGIILILALNYYDSNTLFTFQIEMT